MCCCSTKCIVYTTYEVLFTPTHRKEKFVFSLNIKILLQRRARATFCFVWRHTSQYRQRLNVASYRNREREEKNHMRLFVFYGDMQGNTDSRHNVALYIRIEKNKFFGKLQTKVKKPMWKEENVVVTKLSPHKSNKCKHEQ